MVPRISVLGAGIVGMSQACVLQDKIPEAEITVIAEHFSPNITSDVAAGWWHPYLVGDIPEELLKRWATRTYEYIRTFAKSEDNEGALFTSGYDFKHHPEPIPFFAQVMEEFRELSQEEIDKKRGPHLEKMRQGFYFTGVTLEPTKHLKFLTEKFRSRGGKISQRRVNKFDEVGSDYDVIVNCTGLGARRLVDDQEMFPTRGQVLRVKCPNVKHFYNDKDYYCLLNSDSIVLGGTADKGEWDTTVNQDTAQNILKENMKRVPELKDAIILSHHVGLRPTRSRVRLETEYKRIMGRQITIIHNYGHGGSGVTLFYGCALDGVALVMKELRKQPEVTLRSKL